MLSYFKHIQALLKEVETQETENILKSADLIAQTIINKGSIFTFGASHAGIISEELYYRAGGLMLFNPIFGRELMLDTQPILMTSRMEQLPGYGTLLATKTAFKKDDVLIVHSVSGRNPVSIDLVIAAKEKGVKIIALTNVTYSKSVTSRHPSNKNLYQLADIVLDNHGAIGDACIEIEGLTQKVAPTSTVIGATIMNEIVVQVTQRLKQSGMEYPPIFYSANLDGGETRNKELMEHYKDSIHYKYD